MATHTTKEDSHQQVLKAKDNVEATHSLHQGKDASPERASKQHPSVPVHLRKRV